MGAEAIEHPGVAVSAPPATTPTSDDELMRRLHSGGEDALTELMARHKDRIMRLVHRILWDEESARDLAQETFVRVYRAALAGTYRPCAPFRHWIDRIAINLAINESRRRKRAARFDELLPWRSSTPPWQDPEAQAVRSEITDLLAGAMTSLPPKLRVPLVLREVEGLSYDEISATLEIALGTVKSRIGRARARLRKRLGEHLGERPGERGGAHVV